METLHLPLTRPRSIPIKGMFSNWRNLPRPREKYSGTGPTYNRLNREKEGRREGGGRVCSSDELG